MTAWKLDDDVSIYDVSGNEVQAIPFIYFFLYLFLKQSEVDILLF